MKSQCRSGCRIVGMILLGLGLGLPGWVVGQVPRLSAVRQLKNVNPDQSVFEAASREKPLILADQKSAEKYFQPEELERLQKQVDFSRQVVMVFAWRGSGQDQLDFVLLESFPEQLVFKYNPGRTRDLRSHTPVFVVRNNVIYNGKPVGQQAIGGDEGLADGAEFIRVEVRGTLQNNVLAIGAETTGVQITANGLTWELDLGENDELKEVAQRFDGKQVVVSGSLFVKKGVEIRQRTIVKVKTLKGVEIKADEEGKEEPESVDSSDDRISLAPAGLNEPRVSTAADCLAEMTTGKTGI